MALAATITVSAPATAQLTPPWNGDPISAGLGPTYGEAWCAEAAPGSNIANQQDFDGPAPQDTLALIPLEAIACTLDGFNQLDEAPKIAILVNSANPTINDTSWSLGRIFGTDAGFVSVVNGTNSLQNAPVAASPTGPREGSRVRGPEGIPRRTSSTSRRVSRISRRCRPGRSSTVATWAVGTTCSSPGC
jgi:hypothetical protein